jgi:serine phosphatase RsbU (regulator of sigma subunit)
VPGAFLSIVANDFLKQSTSDKEVRNTNDMLDYLNRSVISNLNQSSNSKIKVKDGMDISLVAIDYKNHKLYYSGANNSAYVYRKTNDRTELIILKPTKQAIGQVLERTVKYDLHEMNLLSGDTIYLFSDGYPDQFGGERDKKLNYKRFKEILAHAYDLPMGLQKNFIEKKLMEWKQETPQTDDICVMGIRI